MWHLPAPNLSLPGSNLCLLTHQGSLWTFLFGVTIQPSIACLARYLPVSEDLLAVSLSSLLHTEHTHTHTHTPQTTHTHTHPRPQAPWEQDSMLRAKWMLHTPLLMGGWMNRWTQEGDGTQRHQLWQPSPATFQCGNAFVGCYWWVSRDWEEPPKIYWSLLFQSS